jgi:AcrR family transcriptional regulator
LARHFREQGRRRCSLDQHQDGHRCTGVQSVRRLFENSIAHSNGSGPSRKEQILDAAARAFAANGYRGNALRDIAQDAGCSLPLLNHHYGSKEMLLEAVVNGERANCRQRIAAFAAASSLAAPLGLAAFVACWVGFEFDLHATHQGRRYLTLMLRLPTDPEVDGEMRHTLDCSEAVVLRGLARARPGLATSALRGGWHMASAALHSAVIAADEADGEDGFVSPAQARLRAVAFLVAGLEACWGDDVPPM